MTLRQFEALLNEFEKLVKASETRRTLAYDKEKAQLKYKTERGVK